VAYTTEQEAWILCQIQKDRKQKQADRAALRQSEQLTENKAAQIEIELEFLRGLEIQNRIHA
jgi:hypothetical protein